MRSKNRSFIFYDVATSGQPTFGGVLGWMAPKSEVRASNGGNQ